MKIKENKIFTAIGKDFLAKLFSSWFLMGAILFFFSTEDSINARIFQSINFFVALALFLVFLPLRPQ